MSKLANRISKYLPTIRKVTNLTTGAIEIVNEVVASNKKPLDYAYAAFKSLNLVVDNGVIKSPYTEISSWRHDYTLALFFSHVLDEVLPNFPSEKLVLMQDEGMNESFTVYDVYGVKVSTDSPSGDTVAFFYPDKEAWESDRSIRDAHIAALGRAILEHYGTNLHVAMAGDEGELLRLHILAAPKVKTPYSDKASEVYNRLKVFWDNNQCRSMILHGPPGTGKSTVIRWVAENLGGVTLEFVDAGGDHTTPQQITAVVRVLKPDIVIINDVDRIKYLDSYLQAFETIRNDCKLILATANNPDGINTALIRPGRFDDVLPMEKPDEAIIECLTKGIPDKYKKLVHKWPAAYIDDFGKRIQFLGTDCIDEEYKELKRRVERADRNYKDALDEDGDEAIGDIRFTNETIMLPDGSLTSMGKRRRRRK